MDPAYRVVITPEGHRSLRAIKDKKARREVASAIGALGHSPQKLGKALEQELEGFRSMRAVRNRFRVLYKVHEQEKRVTVIWVGKRKPGRDEDLYMVAKRLIKTFLE